VSAARKAIYADLLEVPDLWLVDPLPRTVEIYRRDGADWIPGTVHAGAAPMRAVPFDAVELDVTRWWLAD